MTIGKFIINVVVAGFIIPVSTLFGGDNLLFNRKQALESTTKYVDEFAVTHHMHRFHIGRCTRGFTFGVCSFGIYGFQEFSLEDAKKFAKGCVSSYIVYITKNPFARAYFDNIPDPGHRAPGFHSEYVGIRLNFWTKEMNRVKPPYIAEIRFFNNTYHYYQANPETDELVLICEEALENPILP